MCVVSSLRSTVEEDSVRRVEGAMSDLRLALLLEELGYGKVAELRDELFVEDGHVCGLPEGGGDDGGGAASGHGVERGERLSAAGERRG